MITIPNHSDLITKRSRVWWILLAICIALPVGFIVAHVIFFATIEMAIPLPELDATPGNADDSFQHALLASLKIPGGQDPTITANVKNLVTLHNNSPKMLKRYLATHPAWRVFEEQGRLFATRRWLIGPEWHYDLNGYYTNFSLDHWSENGLPEFQTRLTLGLSGTPWVAGDKDTTRLKAGDTAKASLTKVNQLHESHCVISAQSLIVEIFEQSLAKERRLTKTALAHVEKELAPLVAQPTWKTIRAILPPNSIRRGKASLQLRNESHGSYNVHV